MEVHSHTHTPRKKWTHYIWEFLMLFLAVFCGFLAENTREHYIEHKREKQYITTLVADLQIDTAALNQLLIESKIRSANYDSLRAILKSSDRDQHIKELYYYFLPTTYYDLFSPTRRAIDQLLNSGGMRLIRNKNVSDSITDYYRIVSTVVSQGATWLRYFDQYHEVAFKVFDYSQIDTLFYNRKQILDSKEKYILLANDNTSVKILYGKLFALRFILDAYVGYLKELQKKAVSTLLFLKKEYHI
jgi:hypothetical protein